jgi:hypothetical protein
MLSEARYRQVVGEVCRNHIQDNNDFILALAMHGLVLLPLKGKPHPPFGHYCQAPAPIYEIGAKGEVITPWVQSWIADFDWQENTRPEAVFTFTPLNPLER